MRGRGGEGLSALVLLAALFLGKPIGIRVDRAAHHALLIAEVHVLSTKPLRVRVTRDARRIFRGAHLAGRTLDLKPYGAGPRNCVADLHRNREQVLLIVDRNRMVVLAGKREKDDYRLRGWCDFNACFLYSNDKALITGRRRDVVLHTKRLRQLFGKETRAFWRKVVAPAKPQDLTDLLAGLKSEQRERRERAHRELLKRGRTSIDVLRAALKTATDPEEKRRIQAVLDELADYARAHDLAKTLTAKEKRRVLDELADLDRLLEVQRGADTDDHR